MACSTRSRSAGATVPTPLTTRETVARDTPASAATCSRLARPVDPVRRTIASLRPEPAPRPPRTVPITDGRLPRVTAAELLPHGLGVEAARGEVDEHGLHLVRRPQRLDEGADAVERLAQVVQLRVLAEADDAELDRTPGVLRLPERGGEMGEADAVGVVVVDPVGEHHHLVRLSG